MSYASEVLADNPLGYYRLDESSGQVLDSSGNGRNGTANANLVRQVAGAVDSNPAAGFVGNSTITISNDAAFQISTGTIEAFVRASSPGSGYRCIIAKENAFGIFIKDSILITYSWGGASGDKTTGINIANGAYRHVALTFDSGVSNGSIVYLDAQPVLTTTITVALQTIAVGIGANLGGGQNMNGSIDEPAIYGTKLPPDRIRAHWNAASVQQQLVVGMLGTRRV